MIFCTHCRAAVQDSAQNCWNCGATVDSLARVPGRPNPEPPYIPIQTHRAAPLKRFSQVFGLDPRIAFLTLIIDVMLNAGEVTSMGLLLPVSAAAGAVLGYITYKAQISWYGDDRESAKIKAVIIGLLTAIPTPIPELLYIPAGLVGLLHNWRSKTNPQIP